MSKFSCATYFKKMPKNITHAGRRPDPNDLHRVRLGRRLWLVGDGHSNGCYDNRVHRIYFVRHLWRVAENVLNCMRVFFISKK
jgi:hypothetical protein